MDGDFHPYAMSTLHPDWQSTEDEQIVPVRSKAQPSDAPAPAAVSRAPAAFVGIALMLGIAAFSFGGLQSIIGQLTNPTPDVTIHLKTNAPDPTSVTVRPGQVIRWVNDDQIPHVLTSDTLPTKDGKPFESLNIFSGDDFFYTVPVSAEPDAHEYISQTSPDLAGEIIIVTEIAAAASSSSVAAPIVSSAPSDVLVPVVIQSSSSAAVTPLPANVIAINPHVVGTRPPSGNGATSSKKTVISQHKPMKNTDSGPTMWIVCITAATTLIAATRGAFRRV